MPNKETEREEVPSSAVLMASDPRHFEIDLIQREIIMSVQGQIARNSFTMHPSEQLQDFVAGMRTNAATLSEEELAGHIERLKERQGELFEMNPYDYLPTPGMQLLMDLVNGSPSTEVELGNHTNQLENSLALIVPEPDSTLVKNDDGSWPLDRSDAEWDALFQQTGFFDEYPWVASLFAKELVYKEFFRESNL